MPWAQTSPTQLIVQGMEFALAHSYVGCLSKAVPQDTSNCESRLGKGHYIKVLNPLNYLSSRIFFINVVNFNVH